MRKKQRKRVFAMLMAILMVVGLMPTDWALTEVKAAAGTYEVDGTDISIENSTGYTGASFDLDSGGYFKLVSPGGATKVDSNSKTFGEITRTQRIKLYKNTTNPGKIKFTTEGPATVTVDCMSGGSGFDIPYGIYKEDGTVVGSTAIAAAATPSTGTFSISEAGTYYICSYSNDKGLNVYHVKVVEESSTPATGTAPVVSGVTATVNAGNAIDIEWTTYTTGSGDGKTVIEVTNDDSNYTEVKTVAFDDDKKVTYAPSETGNYKFKVYGMVGSSKTTAATTSNVSWTLPLAAPKVSAVRGDGKVTVKWNEVKEATSYTVKWYNSEEVQMNSHDITVAFDTTCEYEITGLTNGAKYGFEVVATRTTPSASETSEKVYMRPYKTADTSNAIPGMTVSDQNADNSLIIIRDAGDITVSQPATSGGVASGGTTNSSFLGLPATTADFKLVADVTIDSVSAAKSGFGISLGVYSDLTSTDKTMNFSSLALRGDNSVNIYRTKDNTGARGGSGFASKWAAGTTYKMEVIRSGNSITVTLYDAKGTLIESKAQDVSEIDKLKAGASVIPAIFASGVNANIKNIKLTEGETVKFDSTALTGSFNPYCDNWAVADTPIVSEVSKADGNIIVKVDGEIGVTGASKIEVVMKDSNNNIVDTQSVTAMGMTRELTFTPKASGDYKFTATASRTGETEVKNSSEVTVSGFVLPIAKPVVRTRTGANSTVVISWDAVSEATSYKVEYKTEGAADAAYQTITASTTELSVATGALTVGTTYEFKVTATRASDGESNSEVATQTVAEYEQRDWKFAAFGSSTNKTDNGYDGNVYDNDLRVYSINGKGKLVPNSSDGLAFYYTAMDAKTENFTLTANVAVNTWTYSNAQEGFGLMACDAVGEHGDSSTFMNNSYMTMVSKVEYNYNQETQAVSDTGDKITMKLGIGALERIGNTLDDNENITLNENFTTTTKTLETSCGPLGAGTYNIIGNASKAVPGTQEDTYTEFKLTIKKDNTGYRCIYEDAAGNIAQETFYDFDNENLTKIDKDNIYIGFFASRNADVSIKDMELTIVAPEDDAPAEVPETTYVTPVQSVTSATATGNAEYDLIFTANADGVVTIKDNNGNVIVDAQSVTANEYLTAPQTILKKGNNKFEITYKPNDDYKPGKYKELTSYDEVTFTHTVNYKTYGQAGQSIWVSPEGKASASGNKADPMDIYTAVKYVQAGQTIVIMEGTYNLESTVKVARGINGTEDNMISMVADPAAESRPVFDFGGVCAGMVLAGDYWYFRGFDVTNSLNGQKGVQVSGNNNVLDQINAYNNGNTGIQISRLLVTDLWDNWPANNTILNCTSHNNADAGYEDADGFAAKLTIADGNEFIGCIANNNADDGWDLFAKIETGSIGSVRIYNCLAIANGYLEDGTVAGNGNGFKLGGDSLPGSHVLENSIAFDNKAKGIDSNSCPDIIVKNCTSFNNGWSTNEKDKYVNVALYTNTAKNTNYDITGVISLRYGMDNAYAMELADSNNIKPLGTQDMTKIYNDTNYFYTGVTSSASPLAETDTRTPKLASAQPQTDWFESLDTKSIKITRTADGSINMNGLLVLTDKAPANAGARIVATPSKDITIPSSVPKTGDTTHIYLFITLGIMSGAALVGLYYYDKKRKTMVKFN